MRTLSKIFFGVYGLLLFSAFGFNADAFDKVLLPAITKDLREPFPTASREFLEKAKFRTEYSKTSEYTKGRLHRKSNWKVTYVRHIEIPKANTQKVVFTLESAIQEVTNSPGKKYEINIEGFNGPTRLEKINLKLDCGLPQEKIENGLREGFEKLLSTEKVVERKAFLQEVVSLAIQNSTSCKSTKFIPIDLALSEAKLPGESWITTPNVEGFGPTELKTTFVGWNVDGNKKHMVLEAKSAAKADSKQDGQTVHSEYTNSSWYMIDSDWKSIRTIHDLDIKIESKLETSTIKSHIETSSKRL